ncbi:MAG TPA: arsenic transporter [Caulobacteraceae bacterium]|nr:arsenic transporter [Caulobacteraceae bacterium]
MTPTLADIAIWVIAGLAAAGVIARPFRLPEAVWAVSGAILLLALGLLPLSSAARAVGKGLDVYLFLTGMMLLSETARREGVFDWVAARAVNMAKGSPKRLFLLIYAVGVAVTTFLSNDATAVVLTPAVFAAAKKAKATPLPYLLVCAFIANAASFVLPISNPANIVLYGDHTPPLGRWLASFALPSIASIIATWFALRWTQDPSLGGACEGDVDQPRLASGGWAALAGIGLTAIVLTVVSALDIRLGAPTLVMGVFTASVVLVRKRTAPWPLLGGVSWAVLPLVAGLFVLVEALGRTGVTAALGGALKAASRASETGAAAGAGALLAIVSNFMNNLPAGLIASNVVAQAHPAQKVIDALLIGVDLGPNLSITGSLATILWLTAIRREGEEVGFWRFLKVGALVAPPALILALGARLALG